MAHQRLVHKSTYILQFIFLLWCSCAYSEQVNTIEVELTNSRLVPITDKIVLLKKLYDKTLSNTKDLPLVFPSDWLDESFDKKIEIDKVNQQLNNLQPPNNPTDTVDNNDDQKLLELKLRWLHFTEHERKTLLNHASDKMLIMQNEASASEALKKAKKDKLETKQNQKEVQKAIKESSNDREKILLTVLLQTEKELDKISQKSTKLGLAQIALSDSIRDWKKLSESITSSFEDEKFTPGSQDFRHFRKIIRDKITESNRIVQSEDLFFTYALNSAEEAPHRTPEQSVVQVRESDNSHIRKIVDSIQEKRVQVRSAILELESNTTHTLKQFVLWQDEYRSQLLDLRGRLITQVIDGNAFALNSWNPTRIELETLSASIAFGLWKHNHLSNKQPLKNRVITLKSITYPLILTLSIILIIIAMFKRRIILAKIKARLLKLSFTQKNKNLYLCLFELAHELYFFAAILSISLLIIDLLVITGFASAQAIESALIHIMSFLILSGLINYFGPLLSQRSSQNQRQNSEVDAMESVFKFVPKVFLYYWLISGLLNIGFQSVLNTSLLEYFLGEIIYFITWVVLLITIWIKRNTWRLINEKATHSVWWRKICERAHGKFWEPWILLIGGGIGVYRVAWSMLVERLLAFELTRSFQARVSRAILEREQSKSTKILQESWFPDRYWNAFHHDTKTNLSWYVSRTDNESSIQDNYKHWKSSNISSRILLSGDRGIGKSALIDHFLRSNELQPTRITLHVGDGNIENVISRVISEITHEEQDCPQPQVCKNKLTEALRALPSQVIIIENLENAMLRKVGGFNALADILDVVLETKGRHFWIFTCTSYAWTIIKHAVIGANCFTSHLAIKGMDEKQLEEFILSRHNDVNDHEPDFTGLNIDKSTEKKKSRLSISISDHKGKDLYFRILWDYTRGNPRQALYYWKSSLTWQNNKAIVGLFDIPEPRIIENFQDRPLMLLTSLIEHNGLTVKDISEVMNIDTNTIHRRIEELSPYRMVYYAGSDEKGGWHIESFWVRTIEYYLSKRQFLLRGTEK